MSPSTHQFGSLQRAGRVWARRSALAAAGALLLAACGASSGTGDDAATSTAASTTADVDSPSTTEPEFGDDIDTSLVGSTRGGWTLFPESGNGGYDVSVYDLDLVLSDDLTSLSGVATITASATQDLQRFSLDARELEIASVTVDGAPAEYTVAGPELVITASEPFPAGSDFIVEVVYEAEPELHRPAGVPFEMGWDVDADEQVFVHGFPGAAATWAPVNEDLDEPAARFITSFEVPEGFTATASGIPTEKEDGSAGVVWDTGIAVFGATFTVAEYESNVLDWKVPVEVSLRPESQRRERIESLIIESLDFVESLFGPFPYERLGVSAITGRDFAFSTPMRIVIRETMPEQVFVHEIAHQWAGNAVTNNDEGSGWLYEGLATYVEALWAESMNDYLDAETTTRTLGARVPTETRTLDGVDSLDDLLDATTYQRGALMYHALRLEIGDDAFFMTLREFIQRHLHDVALVEDLQAVAEEISGQDLDQFFAAWVSDPLVPELPDPA